MLSGDDEAQLGSEEKKMWTIQACQKVKFINTAKVLRNMWKLWQEKCGHSEKTGLPKRRCGQFGKGTISRVVERSQIFVGLVYNSPQIRFGISCEDKLTRVHLEKLS